MANTYKNIVITPNIGSAVDDPKIVFSGANTSTNTDITLRTYPTSNGTISFEGSAGQLFSITNNLTGTLFSVNDVSGIPSIEVLDTGIVRIAQYNGNLGVGTGSPSGKIQVTSSANAGLIIGYNTTSVNYLDANTNIFRTGSLTETMRITSAGNVGIGTSSPATLLDVQKDQNAATQLRVRNDTSGTSAQTSVSASYGAFSQYVTMAQYSPTFTSSGLRVASSAGIFTAGNSNGLRLHTVDSTPLIFGTNDVERMRIFSTGGVSIGNTTDPGVNNLSVGGLTGAQATPSYITMDGSFSSVAAWNALKFYVYKSATESYGITVGDISDLQYWAGAASTGVHRWFTSRTERMRLDLNGNLGIGVTSMGAKLVIGGGTSGQNILFTNTAGNTAARQMFGIFYATASFVPSVPAITGVTETAFDDSLSIRFNNSYNETMRISSAGLVGIGTAANIRTQLTLRGDSTSTSQVITLENKGATNNTTAYYVGGLWGAAYRDVRDPAYIAGIDFYRTSAAGGLASSGDIRFYTDGAGVTLAEARASDERMRLFASGGLSLGNTTDPGATNLSVTGTGSFAAGTVSLPAITTTGDTNTGMFFPAADTIAFAEGGAEAMRINSSGNIQVGGQNGAAKINVTGDVSYRLYNTAATNQSDIGFANAQTLSIATYHASGSAIRFNTTPSGGASTERMRISSTGDVGIGTASPVNYAGYTTLSINNTTGGVIDLNVNGTRTGSLFADSTQLNVQTRTAIPIKFETNATERMRIDSSGNVGIGTSTPLAKLDVGGGSYADANVLIQINAPATSSKYIGLNKGGTFGGLLGYSNGAGEPTGMIIRTVPADPIVFITNNAPERMRIHGAGGVSIGSTTNQGAGTLSVASGIYAESTGPFHLNANTVSANFTIPTNYNASSAGPITINTSITVTVANGSTWIII
jgi:hypothetical protein